jgi:hypothetical protein
MSNFLVFSLEIEDIDDFGRCMRRRLSVDGSRVTRRPQDGMRHGSSS